MAEVPRWATAHLEKGLKSLTSGLARVGVARLPGWGIKERECEWLDTLAVMAQDRHQWRECINFCLSKSLYRYSKNSKKVKISVCEQTKRHSFSSRPHLVTQPNCIFHPPLLPFWFCALFSGHCNEWRHATNVACELQCFRIATAQVDANRQRPA